MEFYHFDGMVKAPLGFKVAHKHCPRCDSCILESETCLRCPPDWRKVQTPTPAPLNLTGSAAEVST